MKIFSNKWCWLIIFLGTLVLSWPMVRLGGKDSQGNFQVYGYWDQLMHAAFTHELMRQFPPQNPLFAGELLYNYNFGSDAIAAVISKTFSLSPITVQFKVLPVVYSLFLGVSAWWLAGTLGMSLIQQMFFLFLTYFGSSFSFLADLFLKKNISWDDAFGLNQPVSYAGNLPILLSLALFMIFLSLVFSWEKHTSLIRGVLISLILAVSPLVKAVSIPVMITAATFSLGYFLISGKRPLFWKLLFAVTAGIFLMALTMWFFGKNSGGLVWRPLNQLERLIESPNFYDLTESWQLSWQTYKRERNLPVMVMWYLAAAGVFIIGNLGSRLIGLLGLLANKKQWQWDWRGSTIMTSLTMSTFLPMFFILGTGGFNISYMFYYAMVIINIPAAVGLSRLIKKKEAGLIWLIIFLALTLPGTLGTFLSSVSGKPAVIDNYVVEDLRSLEESLSSNEVIVIHPFLVEGLKIYISALSGKRVYIEGIEYPKIQGHPVDERLNKLKQWAKMFVLGITPEETRNFLGNENIAAAIMPTDTVLPNDSGWTIWRRNSQFEIILPAGDFSPIKTNSGESDTGED